MVPTALVALRRIKRAWASTFRANSAFDDLRPRRIEAPQPPSTLSAYVRPLFPRIAADDTTTNTAEFESRLRISPELITLTPTPTDSRFRCHAYTAPCMISLHPSSRCIFTSLAAGQPPLSYGKIIVPYPHSHLVTLFCLAVT